MKAVPSDILFLKILKENPYNKLKVFHRFLEKKNKTMIIEVKNVIENYGYEIFESWGTEDIYQFLDNIECYHNDKYYTLKYLYEYDDGDQFGDLLRDLFMHPKHKTIWDSDWNVYYPQKELELAREKYYAYNTFISHSMRSVVGNSLGGIVNFGEMNEEEETFKIEYFTRDESVKDVDYNWKSFQSIIKLINFLKDFVNVKQHRDYLITIIYLYTFTQMGYMINDHEEILTELKNIDKSLFGDKDFYELFKIVFWVFYKGVDAGYSSNNYVFDKYIHELNAVEFGASLFEYTNQSFLVPSYLTGSQVKFHSLCKEVSIMKIKVRDHDFIDPNKVLIKIGLNVSLDKRIKILLQGIFGFYFVRSKTVLKLERSKSKDLYYEIDYWGKDQEHVEELKKLFKTINPRLEKMFKEGSLNPKPFIPGIRLFNELYTIVEILPMVAKHNKTKLKYFDRKLEEHFKMLIFTTQEERDEFQLNFRNRFIDTQEDLNKKYKRWPNRSFKPIIIPERNLWYDRITIDFWDIPESDRKRLGFGNFT